MRWLFRYDSTLRWLLARQVPTSKISILLCTNYFHTHCMTDFLLLGDPPVVTAHTSPPLEEATGASGQLPAWVTQLPPTEKNRRLIHVVDDRTAAVRRGMLRRFHDEHAPTTPAAPSNRGRSPQRQGDYFVITSKSSVQGRKHILGSVPPQVGADPADAHKRDEIVQVRVSSTAG